MTTLVMADGDAPTRAHLDAVWPGWDEGLDRVIAADGGARHASGLGVTIDLWVGDGDSIGEAGLAALEASGVPIERSRADKDESDTELAIRAAIRDGASSVVIVGALGGPRIDHALANVGLLAMPELVGRSALILDGHSRIRLISAPGPDGSAVESRLPGRPGDLVSLLSVGAGVDGVTTDGLAYPLVDEPLPPGRSRGLSNVRTRRDAAIVVRRGLLLVVESPARLSPMTMPAVGDLAPDVALPDETGTIHSLAGQRGRWTILYFYPKDDTPGCTIEACDFRDRIADTSQRGADVWGVSPQGATSKRAFREKFDLPFPLLADVDHAVAEAYGSWVEKMNYGKTYWGTARTTFIVGPDGRVAHVWPKVKAEGHAAEVLATLDELRAAHAS